MTGLFEPGSDFTSQAIQETRLEARRNVVRMEQLLRGLAVTDAPAASDLRREIIEFLAASHDPSPRGRAIRADNLVELNLARHAAEPAAPERAPEIEVNIMDILGGEATGMHIDAIQEHLEDFAQEVTKGNLSVRLHRMVKAGRLMSTARGFYALSAMERARRPL
jgi:hypothetical protein